jgi:hypothetical protein
MFSSPLTVFLLLVLIVGILPLTIFLLRSLQQGSKRHQALDDELTISGEGAEAVEWWEAKRGDFNRGLIASGLLVIGFYYLLLHLRLAAAGLGPLTFSLRNLIFLVVLYLIYMGVANLLYNAGIFTEQARQPSAKHDYRRRLYLLIFWPAMVAPFIFVFFLI